MFSLHTVSYVSSLSFLPEIPQPRVQSGTNSQDKIGKYKLKTFTSYLGNFILTVSTTVCELISAPVGCSWWQCLGMVRPSYTHADYNNWTAIDMRTIPHGAYWTNISGKKFYEKIETFLYRVVCKKNVLRKVKKIFFK